MITARPASQKDEKRLRHYLKSVEKHNVFHNGAKQFSELEVETA